VTAFLVDFGGKFIRKLAQIYGGKFMILAIERRQNVILDDYPPPHEIVKMEKKMANYNK